MQKRIKDFLLSNHILTLATSADNLPYVATCFYVFDEESIALVFASDAETRHLRQALANPNVAAAIHICTDKVGLIRGVQCKGRLLEATDQQKRCYFEAFPIAKAMAPSIWAMELDWVKMTDNRLGFGKKLTWTR